MKNTNLSFINIIVFLAISSCGSDKDKDFGEVINLGANYTSVSKTQFVNNVLLKKCSSFKQRDIQRYNNCVQETKLSLDFIDFD